MLPTFNQGAKLILQVFFVNIHAICLVTTITSLQRTIASLQRIIAGLQRAIATCIQAIASLLWVESRLQSIISTRSISLLVVNKANTCNNGPLLGCSAPLQRNNGPEQTCNAHYSTEMMHCSLANGSYQASYDPLQLNRCQSKVAMTKKQPDTLQL